jgi:hypothetical protein
MERNQIIKSIMSLPEKFYSEQNESIYTLLKETGYFELHAEINEKDIFDLLIQYPEHIKQWLNWSENKRSSSGWYFKESENQKYIVGSFPDNGKLKTSEYTNAAEACSFFIKREIEDIRKI